MEVSAHCILFPSAALPCCVIFEIDFLLLVLCINTLRRRYFLYLQPHASARSLLSPTAAPLPCLECRALVPVRRVSCLRVLLL